MKVKFLVVVVSFLFFSCEKNDVNLEDVYAALSDTEYVSKNYSINEQVFTERIIVNPSSPRIGTKMPLQLKYKEQNLAVIYHTATNSLLIMLAADTEIGNICSVYESQGSNNQLVFVNGKLVEIEPSCALIDWKINSTSFIFLLANPTGKKYMTYKP
ncbi:hypothetical protein JXE04_03550 [Patescibacteria group bacterium]|nr:hypothetical protein [Patescibacteria group bacterium]